MLGSWHHPPPKGFTHERERGGDRETKTQKMRGELLLFSFIPHGWGLYSTWGNCYKLNVTSRELHYSPTLSSLFCVHVFIRILILTHSYTLHIHNGNMKQVTCRIWNKYISHSLFHIRVAKAPESAIYLTCLT